MIQIFQSTLPVWGATFDVFCALVYVGFQSTLPVWGATYQTRAYENFERDFNPRSPCGERRAPLGLISRMSM